MRKTLERWSGKVTKESRALNLEAGVFTWKDPKRIARSLRRSALSSRCRKARPFQSAMSMLNFYINRAGENLGVRQRKVLEAAKGELRRCFERPSRRNSHPLNKSRLTRARVFKASS